MQARRFGNSNGHINLPNKIIINVYLLKPMAVDSLRFVDYNFFHEYMQNLRGKLFWLNIAPH